MKIFKILIILLFFIPAYSFAGQCPTEDETACEHEDFVVWFKTKAKRLSIPLHSFCCVTEEYTRGIMNQILIGNYGEAKARVNSGSCIYVRDKGMPVQIIKLSKDKKIAEILIAARHVISGYVEYTVYKKHYYVATGYIMTIEQYKKKFY